MLKPGGQAEGDAALEFYAKHTAQIEVTRAGAGLGPVLGRHARVCTVRCCEHLLIPGTVLWGRMSSDGQGSPGARPLKAPRGGRQ